MWRVLVSKPRKGNLDHPAKGQGRKDKSYNAITSLEGWVAKLDLAKASTTEGLELSEQGIEKSMEDLRDQIQDLQEGMQGS